MNSYAQNGEDLILAEHFGERVGRFLDVGAYTGREFSNVLALAERGWHGVCVEPSPSAFVALMECHRSRPHVQLVNVAIAGEAGLADFHDSGGDAVSTLSDRHRATWQHAASFRPITVATATVDQLLTRFGLDYDLLSVDVEGQSADLFRKFPFAEMTKLSAIIVEYDGRADELSEWAGGFGFSERARNNENIILVRPLA